MKQTYLSITIVIILALSLIPTVHNGKSENIQDYEIQCIAGEQIHISSELELTSAGFPGDGSESSPYRIEDLQIDLNETYGSGEGIEIRNTRSYVVISNCEIYGKVEVENSGTDTEYWTLYGAGIRLINVTNMLIENCTLIDLYTGIGFENSSSIIATNNSFYHNEYNDYPEGIAFKFDDNSNDIAAFENLISGYGFAVSISQCYNNSFIKNQIEGCAVGMEIFHFSYDNTITMNSFSNTKDTAISLGRCEGTEITWNNITFYGKWGIICSDGSSDATIKYNRIVGNSTQPSTTWLTATTEEIIGLQIDIRSTDNTITMNDFINNTVSVLNHWSGNLYSKNYYSDYEGSDDNEDGIGDSPHRIEGDSPTSDYTPRMYTLDEMPPSKTETTTTTSGTTTNTESNQLSLPAQLIAGAAVAVVILSIIIVFVKKK